MNGDEDEGRRQMARLGLAGSRYLNSGVMLVDLVRWRMFQYEHRAVEFSKKRDDVFGMHDQDTINAVLNGDWVDIPEIWNTWASRVNNDERRVIHFTMVPKPWHADYAGRFKDRFFCYLDNTPFAGRRPWNPWGLGAALGSARRRIPYFPKLARVVRKRLFRRV